MRTVDSIGELPQGAWSYDSIRTEKGSGFIFSPQLLILEDGSRVVPSNLCYVPNVEEREGPKRVYYSTLLDEDRAEKEGFGDFVIWDPVSEVSYIALPLEQGSFILSASESLKRLIRDGSPIAEQLGRLISHFPHINFGILGSRHLETHRKTSDIDLFVYGGPQLKEVTLALAKEDLQQKLGVIKRSDEDNVRNAINYAQEYELTFEQALLMAQNKLRYYLIVNGEKIKMTINSCFSREQEMRTSLFMAPKIGEVTFQGEVVDDTHASSYPREFLVHRGNGELVAVATHLWSYKNNVAVGQEAIIKGNIRVWKGREFISLDDKSHRIFPYLKSR